MIDQLIQTPPNGTKIIRYYSYDVALKVLNHPSSFALTPLDYFVKKGWEDPSSLRADIHEKSVIHTDNEGRGSYVRLVDNLGCPNNIENKEGKMPCDLTLCFREIVTKGYPSYARPEPWPYSATGGKVATRDALVEKMGDYYRENFSGAIYPGRRLTSDLNLYFECEEGRCELPDSWPELNAIDTRRVSMHQRLYRRA